MKKAFWLLLMFCLLPALPALAQPPSGLEGYQARPYIPPDAAPSIRPDSAAGRRLDSSGPAVTSRPGRRDPGLKSPGDQARDRARTQSAWRDEQRRISERSRLPAPQPPLRPGNPNIMGTPGPGQPSFPANR